MSVWILIAVITSADGSYRGRAQQEYPTQQACETALAELVANTAPDTVRGGCREKS